MAWVQIGPHKINTALICYTEQEGDALRIFFQGRWQGNPLELHFDEAKALWRFLKAENPMGPREKGSTMVLPRAHSVKMGDIPAANIKEESAKAPGVPAPTASSGAGSHGSTKPASTSSSGTSGSSHTSHPRHVEPKKVAQLSQT